MTRESKSLISQSFREQAMSFPSRVEQALAEVTTVNGAKDLLDRGAAMQKYAQQLKVSIEIERPIAIGVLRIKAKIAELSPSEKGGRGKKTCTSDVQVFHRNTLAGYRKIHAHRSKLDEYCDSIPDEVPSQHGFISFAKRNQDPIPNPPASELPEGCEVFECVSDIEGRTFGTIYADPPWAYSNKGTRSNVDSEYANTMTIAEIADMPISDLAAEDAHLHLWVTKDFIFEAKAVMDAWGFEYKSMFVWVKPHIGIGNYWRMSHEMLLLGVRGDAKRFNERNHRSWMEFPRGEHSAKPEQIRHIIERVSPGPFLELFGRKPIEGWAVVGNQIRNLLFPV